MSEVKAIIDQDLLNAIVSRISLSGQKTWSGKIDLPLLPDQYDPKWGVTVSFSVDTISCAIEEGRVRVFATVHVQAGNLSYTDKVETIAQVSIDGAHLVVRITSLRCTVYIAPFGKRIDIGDVDLCVILPILLAVRFKLLADVYSASLPGGSDVTLVPSDAAIAIAFGRIEARVTIKTA